jgi:Flp pilus assembly protein TadB
MLNGTFAALSALLFMLLFASFHFGFAAIWDRFLLHKRLAGRRTSERDLLSVHDRGTGLIGKAFAHAADLLSAVGWNTSPGSFFAASAFLGCLGFFGGIVLFQSVRSAGLLALMLGWLPYVLLRMRLVSRQLATRMEFLPAVEQFYQCYLITGCRHVRTALQKTVEERRLPGEVHAVFDQLCRHLSVRGNDEESLRRFSLAFGHTWADYFGSILKVALTEGNNVAVNLKELIGDMRKSQLANQQERHRMLEIRLANFTPVLFLALFLGINFRMNPEGSYRSYMLDPTGRGMLLNALALLFGSLLMGLYLSRRKM